MEGFISFISSTEIIGLFVKLFGIVLGFFYIFYSIAITRQVMVMKKEVAFQDSGLILTLAYVQVLLAVAIVIFALFL